MKVNIKRNPEVIEIEFNKGEKETINKLIRNVINKHMTKVHRKYSINWALAREFFGQGSTVSYEICKALGVDPEGHEW